MLAVYDVALFPFTEDETRRNFSHLSGTLRESTELINEKNEYKQDTAL